MSDSRWLDIKSDFESAIRHFEMALYIDETDNLSDQGVNGYRARMALMHAMQSGYTSAEAAFLKLFAVLREDPPAGPHWHKTLLKRLAVPRDDDAARPAVIDRETLRELEIALSFRHRAMHAYEDFDRELARPAMVAAERLPELLRRTFERIRAWD
ncbi:hypothetical protein [Fulvimarina sp. MAC8]|uniref:ribonuclease toxin HepT-like protein n=1 Tax=Fulvimarina sp. MAC8 TaxID=3162874 RepID=UPI0032ED80B6